MSPFFLSRKGKSVQKRKGSGARSINLLLSFLLFNYPDFNFQIKLFAFSSPFLFCGSPFLLELNIRRYTLKSPWPSWL